MSYDDEFGDFDSDDPLERFNAHAASKGRPQLPDPDLIRKRERERGCTCGGRKICLRCVLDDLGRLLP